MVTDGVLSVQCSSNSTHTYAEEKPVFSEINSLTHFARTKMLKIKICIFFRMQFYCFWAYLV